TPCNAQATEQAIGAAQSAKTERCDQGKRVRRIGATPISILLILYCAYLSVSYSIPSSGDVAVEPFRVCLQTDKADVLELLPGIGPTMADRIVEFRKEHAIESPDDLLQIHGIGQKTVDELRLLTTSETRTQ
ncbi:MAG: helix-hairpin-helix domain-containing protein, partial [Phycisphaerales bacterium]|nr:helix-hairpin-helix domain-containing protein [Phycisphaerales bacterium]